jgi:hypothetical protein
MFMYSRKNIYCSIYLYIARAARGHSCNCETVHYGFEVLTGGL